MKKYCVMALSGAAVCIFLCGDFFYAQASVVLKIVGTNPSKTQTQKIKMKAYLPEEVKPEDILDKNDLELVYDEQKNAYYVSGEYDVEAGVTIEREVEINDIWHVSEESIADIRRDAKAAFAALEDSDLREKAQALQSAIEKRLADIEESQRSPASNPQRHISRYRDNKKLMAQVLQDMTTARSLLAQVKRIPTAQVWKVFLLVLGFFGVLGAGLYIAWNTQNKLAEKSAAAATAHQPALEDDIVPRMHQKKEEEAAPLDIEDIIGKDGL